MIVLTGGGGGANCARAWLITSTTKKSNPRPAKLRNLAMIPYNLMLLR